MTEDRGNINRILIKRDLLNIIVKIDTARINTLNSKQSNFQ